MVLLCLLKVKVEKNTPAKVPYGWYTLGLPEGKSGVSGRDAATATALASGKTIVSIAEKGFFYLNHVCWRKSLKMFIKS
jgi:hypothetical protein